MLGAGSWSGLSVDPCSSGLAGNSWLLTQWLQEGSLTATHVYWDAWICLLFPTHGG